MVYDKNAVTASMEDTVFVVVDQLAEFKVITNGNDSAQLDVDITGNVCAQTDYLITCSVPHCDLCVTSLEWRKGSSSICCIVPLMVPFCLLSLVTYHFGVPRYCLIKLYFICVRVHFNVYNIV